MSDKISHDLLRSLNAKLDALIKLIVLAQSDNKNQSELIRMLSAAGLQPKEIASMLGTTPNTVRVMLFAIRKQKSKGKRVRVKEAEVK